jgi:glycosyltransferase involved in cell wall biosynthesis
VPDAGAEVAPPPLLGGLTIGHFGHFDPSYSRNRIMAKALRRAGADVVELSDGRPWASRTPKLLAGAARHRLDLLLVGFPGHADVAAAKALGLAKGAPVVFDAFFSLWETAEDRDIGAYQARRGRIEDRWSCRLADRVLLDTATHADFFATALGVPRRKLRTVWVGADDEVLRPLPRGDGGGFRVLFIGTYIPLHGADTIVRAAHLLERAGEAVEVVLVGGGQTYAGVRTLAARLGVTNVRFEPRIPADRLAGEIARSDVCLGIFGDSPKAGRVIPNKVFDALAMGRAVVTRDSPAAREALTHGHTAWLCPPADPDGLAAAIALLKADDETRARIAGQGHQLFRSRFSIDALSATVAGIVRELVPADR